MQSHTAARRAARSSEGGGGDSAGAGGRPETNTVLVKLWYQRSAFKAEICGCTTYFLNCILVRIRIFSSTEGAACTVACQRCTRRCRAALLSAVMEATIGGYRATGVATTSRSLTSGAVADALAAAFWDNPRPRGTSFQYLAAAIFARRDPELEVNWQELFLFACRRDQSLLGGGCSECLWCVVSSSLQPISMLLEVCCILFEYLSAIKIRLPQIFSHRLCSEE
uniref:Uncharacterized protein n=1 Tax=Mus musculus TaxID=10090 RepID=Q8BQR5_MOUSE|nr:unnamed protein product [Mus musculus]